MAFSQNLHLLLHKRTYLYPRETLWMHWLGKAYLLPHTWENVLRIHDEERLCAFKECGEVYSHSISLFVHVCTHNAEKPCACKECWETFTQSSYLTQHLRTHSGLMPVECKKFEKALPSPALAKHGRFHTGEKLLCLEGVWQKVYMCLKI